MPVAVLVALSYAVVFVAGLRVVPLSSFNARAFDDAGQFGAPLLASMLGAYAAVRSAGRIRWAWASIAAGSASWGVGAGAWMTYEVILREETPFPSVADAGYLGMLPFMLAGLLLLAPTDRALLRARTALDGVGIVMAAASLVWLLALHAIYEASDTTLLEKAIGGAYPLGDLILFFGVFVAMQRQLSRDATMVLALLSAGLALFMLSDIGFAYETLNETYATGSIVDFGWPFGFLLIGCAAAAHVSRQPSYAVDETTRVSVAWRQALPLGLLLLTFVELRIADAMGATDLPLVIITAVVFAAVVVRQGLVLRDNVALNGELANAGEKLEARVQERTTELVKALEDRKDADAARERLAFILEATPDFVGTADMSGRTLYLNRAARAFLGCTDREDISGRRLTDWHVRASAATIESEGLPAALKDGAWSGETELLSGDGREVPASEVILAHKDADGHPQFISTIARDMSERKSLEDQLRYQAFHDPLTGLGNRARFTDRLEHALLRAQRQARSATVLFMDLDQFKSVNDTFGHGVGDRILAGVAERIRACLRPADTAARFGGDEFAVLLDDSTDDVDACVVAGRLIDALRGAFEIDGREIFCRASIGVNVGRSGSTADVILREADVAMYLAKSRGKNRFELYDDSMHVSMAERLELLGEFQTALDRDEFVLHYQPTVTLRCGTITGVEALVRWEHPSRGTISPAEFIPLAEESGMILPLGRWVLRRACQQAVDWQREFPERALTMAVNVSGRQLQQDGFVDEVAGTLRETGLDPRKLVIEVTESVTIQNVEETISVLQRLKEIGIRLAIDDFGTGYSSLSYLERFPFDILKIDKSFVDTVADEHHETDLTSAIVRIAKMLRLEIVAEGIEHKEQADRLRDLQCDIGQGYYFARPLLAEHVRRLLAESSPGLAA